MYKKEMPLSDKLIKKGSSDFKTIIQDNGYFVDKTMLVKEFFEDSSYTLLIARPKRFGKSLNLSMIEHFFDVRKKDSKELFLNFAISKELVFCNSHQNKYPVINISLKGIKEANWYSFLENFKIIISELYKENAYLLESANLDTDEKDKYRAIVSETASDTRYKYSLKYLSGCLNKHFGEKVIILVDEYDAPIITAFNNTNSPIKSPNKENKSYYERVVNFMQGFLGETFKGNDENLQKGLLTGVMRVGKESIFSEWNNFDVFGITSHYYAESFGFTAPETEKILNDFGLGDNLVSIKKWYNGYKFGNCDNIYNPWSIVNYIANNMDGFKPYWVNSGDYTLIKCRIIEIGVNEKIQDLIEGKTIDKELKDNFVFQDFETNNELIWTLLTDNGYLTVVEKGKYGNFRLKIPNNETKIVFKDIISTWFDNELN